MKVFIIVAAYNESKNIVKTISNLKKYNYNNIVVVDDCSKDNTFNEAKKTKVTVLKHSINRGQGAALQTGMDYALQEGADIIVHFDGDGQHRANEIERLINPIKNKRVDVVFGSRFILKSSKNNVPIIKRMTLKLGTIFNFFLYGVKMTDAHNGFRALSRKAASKIRITEDRMEHASEIVDLVYKANLKYKEVPVTIDYFGESQSSLNAIKMGFKLIFKKIFL